MKTRLFTAILACLMCSCATKLPPGITVTIASGKQVVSSDASGKTFKEAWGEFWPGLAAAGGKLALHYVITQYGPAAARGK